MAEEANDIAWLVGQGQERGEELTGARFLWPNTLGGDGFPCTASPLTNAKRLNMDGGGVALFDDAIVEVRIGYFPSARPAEQQGCKFKPGPGEAWRHMKIETVTVPPPGAVLQMNLNSISEAA